MFNPRQILRKRWQQWLTLRLLPAPSKTLNRRNIFIVPTKAGMGLLATVVLLLFTAINYQNNSLFLLAFTIVGVFVLSILATFDNLNGLRLSKASSDLVQLGTPSSYTVKLQQTHRHASFALTLYHKDKSHNIGEVNQQAQAVNLSSLSNRRGRNPAGAIKIESRYPFGLVRAWSWADLCLDCMVYPKPIEQQFLNASMTDESRRDQKTIDSDDWHNIRHWREGESPKQILWAAYARSDKLLALDNQQLSANPECFDWDTVPGDTETRLSILCYLVLKSGAEQRRFALKLPSVTLSLASGEQAIEHALIALALFGEDDA